MPTVGRLDLEFATNVAQFASDMRRAAEVTTEMSREMAEGAKMVKEAFIGMAEGLMLFEAVDVFKEMVKASADAESAMASVKQTIQSTGGAAKMSADQIEELAMQLEKTTGKSHVLIESMEGILLSFNKVGKDIFPQASKAAIDLSVKFGMDLNQAAKKLGIALEDPVKGMNSLRKMGVILTADQKAMIKEFAANNNVLGEQKVILDAVATASDGAAAAQRDTFNGALQAVHTSVDDLLEAFGAERGLRHVLEEVNVVLQRTTKEINDFHKQGTEANKQATALANGTKAVGDAIMQFLAPALEMGQYLINKMWNGVILLTTGLMWQAEQLKGLSAITGMVGFLTAAIEKNDGALKAWWKDQQAMDNEGLPDRVGGALKAIGDMYNNLSKAATKAQEEVHKAHSKILADTSEDTGGGASGGKKTKPGDMLAPLLKKAGEEKVAIEKVIQAIQQKNEAMALSLTKEKDMIPQIEAEDKVNKMTLIGWREKIEKIREIGKLYAEQRQLKQEEEIQKEGVALKGILESIKLKNTELQNALNKQKEMNPLAQAEEQIRKTVKDNSTENLKIQEQIRAEAQKTVDLEKQTKHAEELKSLDGILEARQKENDLLQLQIKGEEQLAPYIEARKKIEDAFAKDEITAAEHDDKIKRLQQLQDENGKLNDVLAAQDKCIKDILKDGNDQQTQLAELKTALDSTKITLQQYNDAVDKVNSSTKAATTSGKSFVDTLVKGLETAAFSGKNLGQVFKDLAKQLAQLAAEKLLFDPLANWLKGLGGGGGNGTGSGGGGGTGIFGGIGQFLKGLFGMKAQGGPVYGNYPYIVGEQGPEFFLPGQNGMILPNYMMQMFGMMSGQGGMSTSTDANAGGFFGKTPNNTDWLGIEQAAGQSRLDKAQLAYQNAINTGLNTDFAATQLAEAQSNMTGILGWNGQTAGTVGQMRFESPGTDKLLAGMGSNYKQNIDPSVLQYFMTNPNRNVSKSWSPDPNMWASFSGGGGDGGSQANDPTLWGNSGSGWDMTPGAPGGPIFGPPSPSFNDSLGPNKGIWNAPGGYGDNPPDITQRFARIFGNGDYPPTNYGLGGNNAPPMPSGDTPPLPTDFADGLGNFSPGDPRLAPTDLNNYGQGNGALFYSPNKNGTGGDGIYPGGSLIPNDPQGLLNLMMAPINVNVQKLSGFSDAGNIFGDMGGNARYNPDNSGVMQGLMDGIMGVMPSFAHGGRPPRHRRSVVGEHGPEIFSPDGIGGEIIPNHSIHGGGGGDVHIHNNTRAQVGAPSVERTAGRELHITLDEMIEESINNGRGRSALTRTYQASPRLRGVS